MEKDWNLTRLADCYGSLLTQKQREIFDMYYNLDCSLSEIGETFSISRQSVRDCLVGAKESLERYEHSLHLLERNTKILSLCAEGIERCPDEESRNLFQQIKQMIEG